MKPAIVQRVTIHSLSIPLRGSVQHAAAKRSAADPVVVAVELTSGVVGYGETVARSYVTGETADSVVADVQDHLSPLLLNFHPPTFPEALEELENLPWKVNSRLIPAARAAIELALLDACMRHFHRGVDDVVRWMDLPGFGHPGSGPAIRFSGVLADRDPVRLRRKLRLLYWGGLRHFKLKVGYDGDIEHLRTVRRYLGKGLETGRCSLRVDANGAWRLPQALKWLAEVSDIPLAALEQTLPRGLEAELPDVKRASDVRLMHDESLITMNDARRLIDLGVADFFNIRLSKCGGFIPSLRIAALARKHQVGILAGCMVGETSILSAAGLQFLHVCPAVRWAEGLFGTYLLAEDICVKSLRFRFGGRPPRWSGPGWGVEPDPKRLVALAASDPIVLQF